MRQRSVALVACLVLALAGCSPSDPTNQAGGGTGSGPVIDSVNKPPADGYFRIGLLTNPPALDPILNLYSDSPSSDLRGPKKLAAKTRAAYIVIALLLPDLRERAAEGRLGNDGEGGCVRGDVRQIEERRQVILRTRELSGSGNAVGPSAKAAQGWRGATAVAEGDRGGAGGTGGP